MLIEAPERLAPYVTIVPIGDEAENLAIKVLRLLRESGVSTEMAYRGNTKKRFAKADQIGARYAVVLGEEEIANDQLSIRDLRHGIQRRGPVHEVIEALKEDLGLQPVQSGRPLEFDFGRTFGVR
jgi:histidyl-tRNA synthetase